jgi:distribution and morphology protein 31
MSWITSGKLDAVLDIKFPHHPDDQVDIKALIEEISRNVASITGSEPDHTNSISGIESNPDPDLQPIPNHSSSISDTLASSSRIIPGQHRLHRPPLRAPIVEPEAREGKEGEDDEGKRIVTVDIDLRFRDLKAAVPIWSGDLSVANNALIRPIVAFIK